jgi:hypothetical protein
MFFKFIKPNFPNSRGQDIIYSIDVVVGKSKLVNIKKFYNSERLRPYYNSF